MSKTDVSRETFFLQDWILCFETMIFREFSHLLTLLSRKIFPAPTFLPLKSGGGRVGV